ncbi:MAG TPA: hypothetical protein VMS56_06060 [Thermoanaerobaculia bacterium]|nr:hypothetical protein [Thermoanaerobaculia bacterium]
MATSRTEPRFPVTEKNLQRSADRLITTRLVSQEIEYLQRTLGSTAGQAKIDDAILAVRKLPWAELVAV